tara:strand:+ start:925 stop:1224 length:300 start_codon:yes stop_codon:yes gene_type:complete
MSLFQQVMMGAQVLDTIMSKNKEDTGTVYGESAAERRSRINFSRFKRDSLAPVEAGEVRANEAISYEELYNNWDRVLSNMYAELIERQSPPSYTPKRNV